MTSWSSFGRSPIAALAVILVILLPFWAVSKTEQLTVFDQRFYLGIAYDLYHNGKFTDGVLFASPDASGQRPSGMRFTPLYPAMLAAAAMLDPEFRTAMDCTIQSVGNPTPCPASASLVRGLQFIMLSAVYLMAWRIAWVLAGSPRGAWIALGLALCTAPYLLRSVNYLMTEMTALFLSTALAYSSVVTAVRRSWYWAGVSGIFLGLAALTRPAFLYLFMAVAVVGLARTAIKCWHQWRDPILPKAAGNSATVLLAALITGFVISVGPWILRNELVLDRAALSFGYASDVLVQRISFDTMTWREYPMAYLCGLPDGTGMGNVLAGQGSCDRFNLTENPETFYGNGVGPLLRRTLEAAGGREHHMSYLVSHYLLREPVKHVLVTIPMALRGAWVQKYWGLILAPVCLVVTIGAVRRRNLAFLALALPAWFMLAFYAAVAVNQVRYNLMLVPPYAIAGAMVIDRCLSRSRLAS